MRHVVKRHNVPLTEPVFLILISLAEQPRHGYALLKDIEAISQGRVCLSTGTLYEALRRLLETGAIERFEQEDKSREKLAYKLTALGHALLLKEIDRLNQLTAAASARLKLKEVYG